MAEIGLIASVIGVAGAGLKLSITLYTFSETVATAADSIKAIAKDVSLTSAVLEELGSNLKHDEQARLYSGTALKTAQTVVVDCEAVFKQIDGALSKSMERISGLSGNGRRKGKSGKVVLSAMEKLKWPFLQPKMQELRANLERLKSTLVLMLNVLTYARRVQTEYATPNCVVWAQQQLTGDNRKQSRPAEDDYQRLLIENLVAANQEATRNFHTLLKTIGPANETSSIAAASTSDLSIGGSTIMAQEVGWGQEQPKSLAIMEANSGRQRAPDTNMVERARDILASDDDRSADKFTISDKYSATETTMACLKRIQQALDQFEASEESLKSASQIAVSIEVFKHISYSDFQARKRKPWEVASIARRLDGKELEAGLSDKSPQRLVDLHNVARATPAAPSFFEREEVLRVDPYISADGSNTVPDLISGNQRTAALQAQIDDTVGVMRENINKVTQRGEKLDALQDKTDYLSSSSQAFKRGPNRFRKQQGWLSTLNRAWQNLPSAKDVAASTDKFFQE
jgi:hypothetical protein